MLDFAWIATRRKTATKIEVYPKFNITTRDDLMIRGGDFYAVWDETHKLWSLDEKVVIEVIDAEIKVTTEKMVEDHPSETIIPLYMRDSDSGSIDRWHKYCQRQCRDQYRELDEKVIFSNTETKREDYASKKLSYSLESKETPAYDEIIQTLYSDVERHKIEWAIGSIISGDSKKNQKFLAMYGEPGSGKGTIINIIAQLFEGYCTAFEAKVLGSATASFPLEAFKNNPLIAYDSDADLSKVEDNTRLNALISHETMPVNTKYGALYTMRFNTFIVLGTNKPIKITDSRSGLIRRLIDVFPSGQKIPEVRYENLFESLKFELGGIAYKCLQVYKRNPRYYSKYVPTTMIGASNDFYNFVLDSYDVFKRDDQTTLKAAYEMYKIYCDEARVPFPYSQRVFKEELKSYFKTFEERAKTEDETGLRPRNLYKGFIADKFLTITDDIAPIGGTNDILVLDKEESLFDKEYADCSAQYANAEETPTYKWANVKTKLKDLDTHKLHYVKVPENLIVIDFDLKDDEGNKSLDANLRAAALWPRTYAELSKGGQGVHLHYIYTGDPSELSHFYTDNIEVKTFSGGSSLRRRLSKCNDIPIANISSGLPLMKDKKAMIDFQGFKDDQHLKNYILQTIAKKTKTHELSTRQAMTLIEDALNKAYDSGLNYDLSSMYGKLLSFASSSSNSAEFCYKLAGKLKLVGKEKLSENFEKYDSDILVFFDCEVFPNLFVVVYMGEGKQPVALVNPSPTDISELVKFKLVGFNCREYDNHILYARMLGASNKELFNRSCDIINKSREAKFRNAYNISYTDIFDFASKKQGLKKWEIEMGEPHLELGLPWDQPVPEDQWHLVVEYCINDVKATAALFHYLKEDWKARQILADLAGGTVNDTTNTLTTMIVFGNERNPQLVYTDLATGEQTTGR